MTVKNSPGRDILLFLGIAIISLFLVVEFSIIGTLGLIVFGVENLNDNPKIYLLNGLVSQLFLFILPFIIFLKLKKIGFKQLIDIDKIKFTKTAVILSIFILSYPIIYVLSEFNSGIEILFPNNSYILMEKEMEIFQMEFLKQKGLLKLMSTIIVIGIMPAIGEELVFRGFLMKKIFQSTQNIHFSVFISSLFFAALHFQPTKLLPMIFLGMLLAYVYHYTKNIYYSMILHFTNNAGTILLVYFYPEILI